MYHTICSKLLASTLCYLLMLLSLASALTQPTRPPYIEASPTLLYKISVITAQKTAVINRTITSTQLQSLGYTAMRMANQAEAQAVTTAFDTWVRQNYSIILAKYPGKKAQLDYLVKYGIHYVLYTAAATVAAGSAAKNDAIAHFMNASYGNPQLLFVMSGRCSAAGVVGGALTLAGSVGTFWGAAAGAVIAGFAGAALVVGAAVLLTAAMYCQG